MLGGAFADQLLQPSLDLAAQNLAAILRALHDVIPEVVCGARGNPDLTRHTHTIRTVIV
jgi:hypothetical protein